MKIKVAFCIFVTFYIIQINSADVKDLADYKTEVSEIKSQVEGLFEDISRTKQNLHSSTISKLNVKSQAVKDTIKKLSQDTWEQNFNNAVRIKTKQNYARVDKCFEKSEDGVNAVMDNVERRFTTCRISVLSVLNGHIRSLNVTEINGKELVHEIDNILPLCIGPNQYILKVCVDKRIKSANDAAEAFKLNFYDSKAKALDETTEVLAAADRCYTDVTAATKPGLDYVREELLKCLKDCC